MLLFDSKQSQSLPNNKRINSFLHSRDRPASKTLSLNISSFPSRKNTTFMCVSRLHRSIITGKHTSFTDNTGNAKRDQYTVKVRQTVHCFLEKHVCQVGIEFLLLTLLFFDSGRLAPN